MPVHIVERMQKMNRAERTLWMELGREPTLDEIAEEASLPIEQAREVKAAAGACASRAQPVGEQEDAVFGDFVAGDEPLPEERVEVSLRSQALAVALQALPDRERMVLVLRYGLVDEEPKTLEEIGKRLGLTRERVRQIELESLRKLSRSRTLRGHLVRAVRVDVLDQIAVETLAVADGCLEAHRCLDQIERVLHALLLEARLLRKLGLRWLTVELLRELAARAKQ